MDVTRHLRISGRVQGVGFRYSLLVEAKARGLAGWVRNRRDGSVEALLQGEAAAVDATIAWARRGPTAARVDKLDVQSSPELSGLTGFDQLPTL
jgi:acylphosphatase